MADTKITALAAIATVDPAADVLPIVDISDTSMAASGTTKKVTSNQILGAGGTATLASASITGAATVGTTLGVTGVSTFAAGTALLPALTTTGDTNTGIYYPAADTFAVTTAGVERYRVDSAGQLGIGVTPSATDSTYYQALELARAGQGLTCVKAAFTGTPNSWLSNNSYATYSSGTVWKYAVSSQLAAQYRLAGGEHQWFNAPDSGVSGAGTTATFTQAMTLDASGNLLVAGTSAYIRAGGRTQILGGSVVDINTAGNNVGIAFGGASSILPCDGSSATTDGVANFGSASKRWNTIYASTGTINTSDQNEKQDIADLGDAEKRVAGKIKSLVKKYRFKDAVASKGENARIHVGWIAQDIQNAFSSEGLDASKYGVFCSDTWEENGVQKTRLGLRYDEVLAFVVSAI